MVLRRFSQHFDSLQASTNDVRLFLLDLQSQGLKPGSCHVYYRSLKTYFNWLVAEGLLEHSPMANIKSPKNPPPLIKPFSATDIQNLMKLCPSNKFLDLRNKAIFLTFLDTGLRLEELSIKNNLEPLKCYR